MKQLQISTYYTPIPVLCDAGLADPAAAVYGPSERGRQAKVHQAFPEEQTSESFTAPGQTLVRSHLALLTDDDILSSFDWARRLRVNRAMATAVRNSVGPEGVQPEGPALPHFDDDAEHPLRIAALGGGTGLPAVLEGLADLADEKGHRDTSGVTGIVTVTDDGGSSGRLREQLGVLPPGDARNCLLALTARDSSFKALMQQRLDEGPGVVGHPVGNLLLAALTQATGDFASAVQTLGRAMDVRGQVLPSTGRNVRLRAEFHSGECIDGETSIVSRRAPIKRLSLEPSPRPLPEVLLALVNADGIVVGPGSLYTSILPTLLVEGVAATIYGVNAVRIYVANLMTEPGETDDYSLDDHLAVIRAHTGFDLFDYVLINRRSVNDATVRRYAERGSQPVVVDRLLNHAPNAQVVECDLATEMQGAKIRHHPRSLARAVRALVRAGRPDVGAAA